MYTLAEKRRQTNSPDLMKIVIGTLCLDNILNDRWPSRFNAFCEPILHSKKKLTYISLSVSNPVRVMLQRGRDTSHIPTCLENTRVVRLGIDSGDLDGQSRVLT